MRIACAGARQHLLGEVEGVVPPDGLEVAVAASPERILEPVAGAEVREREAALVAEPALVDLGVVAREDPLDLPSRTVALMLQPTGQSPQTVGTFWISHGRASKRYWVEVRAPTGQSSITLPENGAR